MRNVRMYEGANARRRECTKAVVSNGLFFRSCIDHSHICAFAHFAFTPSRLHAFLSLKVPISQNSHVM